MIKGLNQVMLIGRVAREPVSAQANGKDVTRVTLEVQESERASKSYPMVVGWEHWARGMAEWKTGDPVFVKGKYQTRSYEKDGEKRYATQVSVQECCMIREGTAASRASAPEPPDDDIPF